jgi:Tol biopolymer transport system component
MGPEFGASSPALSVDGRQVAFVSNADLTGANPSHLLQVFIIGTDGHGVRQLTAAETALPLFPFFSGPAISGDGAVVAFVSDGDPLRENPQRRVQLFLIRADGTGLPQLTRATSGFVRDPALSAEGTMVAFTATADLTGGEPRWQRRALCGPQRRDEPASAYSLTTA